MRAAFATAGIVIVLLTGCWFLPEEEELVVPELPEPPQVSALVTYPVERGDIYDVIEGYGRVSPVRETVVYFRQTGRVQMLEVEANAQVEQGQLLAQLEIDSIVHQLRVSEIDLRIAEAHLAKMTTANSAPIDREIQGLVVERQRIIVERHRQQVEHASIRAPHAGFVRRVQVQVGDMVREFEPVIEVADPGVLELRMTVSDDAYRSIDASMDVEVQVGPDRWAPVRIVQMTHLNPRFDAGVRREEFVVHLSMPAGDHDLRAFSQYPVRIFRARRENALVIPSAALREARGRLYVRVADDQVRREVDVRVGVRGATRVEILEGLSEGDVVIGR